MTTEKVSAEPILTEESRGEKPHSQTYNHHTSRFDVWEVASNSLM